MKQTATGNLLGGFMNNVKVDYLDNAHSHCLANDKTMTFSARTMQIECRQGVVWVTWPDRNERVLQKGQAMAVVSKGVICVQAFALSTIVVHSAETKMFRRWVPHHPAKLAPR
jgi:hypothetical protein